MNELGSAQKQEIGRGLRTGWRTAITLPTTRAGDAQVPTDAQLTEVRLGPCQRPQPPAPFAAEVGQYLDDPAHLDVIGTITVQAQNLIGREAIEVRLRNNDDGTLGIKVIDPAIDSVIPFAYDSASTPGRDLISQRQTLQKFRINSIED